VAGGDLDVPQVHSGIEHGRDEGVAEHMRVRPGNAHPSSFGQPPQAPGGSVAVHPGAASIEQDGPADTDADRAVNGSPDRWRQRDQDDLAAFAAHPQHPVTVLFAKIGDVRGGGLEDPQAEQPEHGHQREVARVR
jgi:hypothetical protein